MHLRGVDLEIIEEYTMTTTSKLSDILFAGTAEEHKQTREELEELMRAVQERRSNVRREEEEGDE